MKSATEGETEVGDVETEALDFKPDGEEIDLPDFGRERIIEGQGALFRISIVTTLTKEDATGPDRGSQVRAGGHGDGRLGAGEPLTAIEGRVVGPFNENRSPVVPADRGLVRNVEIKERRGGPRVRVKNKKPMLCRLIVPALSGPV